MSPSTGAAPFKVRLTTPPDEMLSNRTSDNRRKLVARSWWAECQLPFLECHFQLKSIPQVFELKLVTMMLPTLEYHPKLFF